MEDWSDWENDLVVQAYMEMAACEMRGERLSKVSVYRTIAAETGRAAKAVEFKFLNVSGVLRTLGLGHVAGLKPYGNFQEAMAPLVVGHLEARPAIYGHLAASGAPAPQNAMESRGGTSARVTGTSSVAATKAPNREERRMEVQDLWHYATGGSDVAALPGHPSQAPVGPRPAGVDAAVEWMELAFRQGHGENRRLLFLVGGPGGGKSDVAASLVSQLTPLKDTNDGLAHRSYRFQSGGGPVLLINDATIPAREGRGAETLADDIARADGHVIACVNRGVLVDEAARAEGQALGLSVARWLRHEPAEETDGWTTIVTSGREAFLRQATFVGPNEKVDAVAVFVDVCSLIEERPQVALDTVGALAASGYKIKRFKRGADRTATPAGKFLSTLAAGLSWEGEQVWDPIAANLASLQTASVQSGVLSILRAAEIASSQRFSYRQLWGILARLVAGPLPERIKKDQLVQWLDSSGPEGRSGAKARFEALRTLAAIRLHQALFGDDWTGSSRHPILSFTVAVDPARDMVPGDPKDAPGWASPVSEAFAGGEPGGQPLQIMLGAANSQAVSDYVTDFDEALDDAFVEAMQEASSSRGPEDLGWRLKATAWYGRYLTRMLAVAHGIPAFESDIRQWTWAWDMTPGIPQGLLDDLKTLFRPPRHAGHPEEGSQIPLFGSRAEALFGVPDSPTLVSELATLAFASLRRGEELGLVVKQHDKEIGRVQLDLDLVREASAGGANWLGLTDATESVVPRLERFRSLSLTSANRGQNGIKVVTRDNDYDLVAAPEGDLYA